MLGFSKKDKIKSFIKILKKAAAEMEAIGFDDSNLGTGFAEMEAEITELEDNHTELKNHLEREFFDVKSNITALLKSSRHPTERKQRMMKNKDKLEAISERIENAAKNLYSKL